MFAFPRWGATTKGATVNRRKLSTHDAEWLSRTFARNAEKFGGWSMELIDPPKPADPPKPDEPLGDAGKKALDAEREARKKAEGDLATLRTDFDAFRTTLAEATGVKPAKGDDGSEVLKQVQDTLAQIQRENVVLALANEHKITEADDLAILRGSTADADGMSALAKRLAPSEDAAKPGTPKPDKTQGPKGEPVKPDMPAGVPRMAAALDEAMNNPN